MQKIRIAESRVDSLLKLKKTDAAISQCKQWFHLSLSLAAVVLLNGGAYSTELSTAMEAWLMLMRLQRREFDCTYKK